MTGLGLDLNLLQTFVTLCDKKNLKLTGLKYGISESAVSKQLSRLREQLDDNLFERTKTGLEPTAYSLSILPQVKQSLSMIEKVIESKPFSPKTYKEKIVIALAATLLDSDGTKIYQSLQKQFPHAAISLITWSKDTIFDIVSGEVTYGLHYLNDERPKEIYQKKIMDDHLITVVNKSITPNWEEVKNKPFIKFLSYGWNEQRFRFLGVLKEHQSFLNFQYEVDNMGLVWQLLKNEPLAFIMPRRSLNSQVIEVNMPKSYSLPIILTSNIRLKDRANPLHTLIHSSLIKIFKN